MANSRKNLYLTSEVDIPTGEKHDKGDPKPVKRVGPGILSELDITNEEIASLPRGVVRAATADEIEAAEQRASQRDPERIVADAEYKRQEDEAKFEAEKRRIAVESERAVAARTTELETARHASRAESMAETARALNEAAAGRQL